MLCSGSSLPPSPEDAQCLVGDPQPGPNQQPLHFFQSGRTQNLFTLCLPDPYRGKRYPVSSVGCWDFASVKICSRTGLNVCLQDRMFAGRCRCKK